MQGPFFKEACSACLLWLGVHNVSLWPSLCYIKSPFLLYHVY